MFIINLILIKFISFKILTLGTNTPTKDVVTTSENRTENHQLTLPSVGLTQAVACSQLFPLTITKLCYDLKNQKIVKRIRGVK